MLPSRPRLWALVCLVACAASGCDGAGFAGGSHRSASGSPPPLVTVETQRTSGDAVAPGAGAGTTPPPPLQTDNEGETADPPQQVSGAFLACVAMDDSTAGAGNVAYGCRVKRAGAVVDLASASVAWDVVDKASGASLGAQARFTVLPPGSPFHVALTLPAGQDQGRQATAAVKWTAAAPKAEVLKADLGAGAAAGHALRIADGAPFHLGDGNMNDSKCVDKVEAVPLFGQGASVRLTVPAGGATLTVTLSGLCGVDFDGANVLSVRRDDGFPVASLPLAASAETAATPQVTLAPGSYLVELDAGGPSDDLDDFVFKDLIVDSSVGLTAGALTPVLY